MTQGKTILIVIIMVTVILVTIFFPKNQVDKFGIQKIYPTVTDGREWYSNWDNGTRVVDSIKHDPYDFQMVMKGSGKISIDGQGIASISGKSPRIYVFDKSKPKWNNVEITFYAKRITELGKNPSQGFIAGARSEHQDEEKNPCNGLTYYGKILYDGRIGFQKELAHDKFYSTIFPKDAKINWETKDGGLPRHVWVGIKFIVFSKQNGVKLELYKDLKNGLNGGQWEKIAEFFDKGEGIEFESDLNLKKLCGYDEKKILFEPGTSVFLRNDEIMKAEYKNFSIREILPPL